MSKMMSILICACFVLPISMPASGADEGDPKQKKDRKVYVLPNRDFEFPDIEIDLNELEKELEGLDRELGDMDFHLRDFEDLHIYHLDQLRELEDLYVEIPEIAVEIPPLPPIPEFNIHIPDMDIHGFYFNVDPGASRLFRDLSEEEQIRLQALRSVARQDAATAFPALEKTIREDSSPALRYEAVRQLGRFFEDERVVPLLGHVAKNDSNIKVRKKAIQLLGKSKDPRAVEILEDIVGK